MKNEGKQGRQIAGILLSALACGMILYTRRFIIFW